MGNGRKPVFAKSELCGRPSKTVKPVRQISAVLALLCCGPLSCRRTGRSMRGRILCSRAYSFPSVSEHLNGLAVDRSWPFASLFVTYVQRDLFKLSITNSCSPTSNSTGWCLDIPLHKLVLIRRLMSTGDTCSAVRIYTLFHPRGHTRVTFRDVNEQNS